MKPNKAGNNAVGSAPVSRGAAGQIAIVAVMIASLEAVKLGLAFLPNVELVTLFIILFTRKAGGKTYFVVAIFVLIECLIWGFGIWSVSYLFVWPLLVLLVQLLKRFDSRIVYCILSGFFGLLFGGLCSLVYIFISGPSTALAWWIAGIPWDIAHGASNFLLCFLLYNPLVKVTNRFIK